MATKATKLGHNRIGSTLLVHRVGTQTTQHNVISHLHVLYMHVHMYNMQCRQTCPESEIQTDQPPMYLIYIHTVSTYMYV